MIEPLVLLRALHFAATLSASGTVFFLALAAEPAAEAFAALRQRLVWWVWLSLGVAVATGAAWLVWLASDILGTSMADACLQGGAWSVLEGTRFGEVWSVRAALALLLGLLMPWPGMRRLQVACAVVFAALPALVGHAGATPGATGVAPLVADMGHLVAAAAWVGGLPALVMMLGSGGPGGAPDLIAAVTARFSRLAMASVAVLLASGIANSWNLLEGPADLLATDYGRLVALKIGLFAAMVAIAAVNRFRLTPRLAHPQAVRALRRNSLAETGLGLCVLLLVGTLGTIPPSAHRHPAGTAIPEGAAFVHIHASEAMAELTLDPGRAGTTHATIRVMHEDSSQFPAKDVSLDLDPPSADLPKINRPAARSGDGTWRVENIELPRPGIWTATVIITPFAGAPIVLDAPIVIEPGP